MSYCGDLTDYTGLSNEADQEKPIQPPNIASLAAQALEAFERCLHLSASYSRDEAFRVDYHLRDFEHWTHNAGVFSPGRACLDHAVRPADSLHDGICSDLKNLIQRIQDSSSILEKTTKSRQENSTENDLNDAIKAIAKVIKSLYERIESGQAKEISRRTWYSTDAKRFPLRDDDNNDEEPRLRKLYLDFIRGRFPNIKDYLPQRLAEYMVLQRKRTLLRRYYHRAHPLRVEHIVPRPKIVRPQFLRHSPEPSGEESEVESEVPLAKGITASQAAKAAEKAAEMYRQDSDSTPSAFSATQTFALSKHEDLVFPPAPNAMAKQVYGELKKRRKKTLKERLTKIPGFADYEKYKRQPFKAHARSASSLAKIHRRITKEKKKFRACLKRDWICCNVKVGEVVCPFCLYVLPALSVSDDERWKAHITSDLEMYVCLFDKCETPTEPYYDSDSWFLHMRDGRRSQNHDAQDSIAQGECPICGANQFEDGLECHIAGHLKFLALKALPLPPGYNGPQGFEAANNTETHALPVVEDCIDGSACSDDGDGEVSPSPYAPW
ncbi:putative protein phosphatase-1 [Metarhizium anisopliae]|nr:putative protein phosphatase-1 [Metarhizium anisopliae]